MSADESSIIETSPPIVSVPDVSHFVHFDQAREETAAEAAVVGGQAPPPSVANLTPHEIIRRIGLPVVERDGRHICPVCNLGFEHAQALGPHFRLHWQEAGVKLADIPSVQKGRARCPECDEPLIRHSLNGHLKGKHGYDNGRANGVARTLGFDLDAYLNPPPPPPAPAPKPKAERHKPNYEERQVQYVVCSFGECGAVHKRKYMASHFVSVHGVDRHEARTMMRALPASRHTKPVKSKLPIYGRKTKPSTSTAPAVL